MAEQQDEPEKPVRKWSFEKRNNKNNIARRLQPRYSQKKSVRQIAYMVRCYAMDRRRLRELTLFRDRLNETGKVARQKSRVLHSDRPEVELILHRIDEILRLNGVIEQFEAKLNEVQLEPDTLAECIKCVTSLKQAQMEHLDRVEGVLSTLNKEIGKRELIMAKMTSDLAHLTLSEQQHQDKMALALRQPAPSAAELRLKLAERYGVTPEEVDKVMGAKSAEAERIEDANGEA
jgi:hypothetical protein